MSCDYDDILLKSIPTGPYTKVLIQLTTMCEPNKPPMVLFNFRKFRRRPDAQWFPLRDSGSGIALNAEKHLRDVARAIQSISKQFGFKIVITENPVDEQAKESHSSD